MAEILLLIIRWLHAVAAVSWVGGGIFYWVILRPALRAGDPSGQQARLAGPEFGQLVTLAMWTLVITGAILSFDRLSAETATVTYFTVLAIKIAAAGWMFAAVWNRRRGTPAAPASAVSRRRALLGAMGGVNVTVVLGLVVFFISDLLRFLVEQELRD